MNYETGLSLQEILEAGNLCEILDEDVVARIGQDCKRGLEIDEESRADWILRHDRALDLAMQVSDEKTYPFEGASNVIYPLITTGANQFAARAYPAIVPGSNLVKCRVNGDDSGIFEVLGPDPQTGQPQTRPVVPAGAKAGKAARVSQHMSFQLLDEMEEWEPDTDALLTYLAIAGSAFRKLWFDNNLNRPRSKFIPAINLIINMDAESIDESGRVSERFGIHPHDVIAKVRRGEWSFYGEDLPAYVRSVEDAENVDAVLSFIEQYVRLDLDGDGYPEPYVVHFREDDGKVFRISPHFTEQSVELNGMGEVISIPCYPPYVHYPFLPNPQNGFYAIGLGWLLGPLNEQINTTLNQINDAAHLQNTPMGFVSSGLKIRGGEMRFKPGEFKFIDSVGGNIRENLYQLQFPGPSPVLYQLLGLMIQSGQDIASVKDAMMGGGDNVMQPMALQQLIEQGTVQFNSIFKRVHRALKRELRMLFHLNAQTLDERKYYTFLDSQQQVSLSDYDVESLDVTPVTDPQMAARGQKATKAAALAQAAQAFPQLVNPAEVLKAMLDAAGVDEPEKYITQPQPPQPDFKEQAGLIRAQNDSARVENDRAKIAMESLKGITEMVLNLARAESEEEGAQLDGYISELNSIAERIDASRRDNGMAGTQGNQGGVQGNPQGNPIPQGSGF